MIFSYNWLQSLFQKKLPRPEKLAKLLTMHLAEVEKVKKEGQDFALAIDIRPNRAYDCFSHLGIAREIAAITNLKFSTGVEKVKLEEDKNLRAKDFVSIEVKDKKACPRYTARVVIGVKVGPSPKWIKDRLKICNLRPINNIVDIANYVMLETGQPLHAFDGEKLKGNKIIVRLSKENEEIITLDGEKYRLKKDILVIADERSPVAIAGIKGGKSAEVAKGTKLVVLESANFNRIIIRRASQKLNLKTDASLRFDHGIDPNLTEFAINRAAYLIQKLAAGKVTQGLIDFYPKKTFPKRIKLDLNYLEKLLGIKIPAKEIENILKRLNFRLIDIGHQSMMVEIPTFRLDISIPEDLIEEVGRIYGYEKIPASFPIAVLIPPKRNLDIFWEDIAKNILKEAGFSEVYNYSFVSEKEAKTFSEKGLIEVKNPTSLDFQYLRPSLIPNLLKNVKTNQKIFKEIKIFELGKIFKNFKEKRMLTGLMTGDSFYQLKGVIDLFLNKLGISNIWYDDYLPTPEESKLGIFEKRKCAEIKVNNNEIGFLGAISRRILEELKIERPVIIFDLDFEKLQKFASEEQEYRPISRYPAAVRDLAVLVPREVRVEEVLNKIETTGGSLVRDIDLFDIYEGEEIPEGKKNLAFRIVYQSQAKTLSPGEIDKMQNEIIDALEENPNWEVRK